LEGLAVEVADLSLSPAANEAPGTARVQPSATAAAMQIFMSKTNANSSAQDAKNLVWFVGTKVSCSVSDILADLTSRGFADSVLLNFARETKLHDYPRAKEYLTHYLNGSGKGKSFPLADLLNQDPGVREIVKLHFSYQVDDIVIGRRAYRNQDWRNSLGTYWIYYRDVGNLRSANGRETRHVVAWGEDTYQWHPEDEKRFTQVLGGRRVPMAERGRDDHQRDLKTPSIRNPAAALTLQPE
jgi:hypothetical protein